MSGGLKSTVYVLLWFACLAGLVALMGCTLISFSVFGKLCAVSFLVAMLIMILVKKKNEKGKNRLAPWDVVWMAFFLVAPALLVVTLLINRLIISDVQYETYEVVGYHVMRSKQDVVVLELADDAWLDFESHRRVEIGELESSHMTCTFKVARGIFGMKVCLDRELTY
jgi:amino acid transporter